MNTLKLVRVLVCVPVFALSQYVRGKILIWKKKENIRHIVELDGKGIRAAPTFNHIINYDNDLNRMGWMCTSLCSNEYLFTRTLSGSCNT